MRRRLLSEYPTYEHIFCVQNIKNAPPIVSHLIIFILIDTTTQQQRVMKSGKILIPQIEVLPTAVQTNGDMPPEVEIRFDMPYGPDFVDMKAELPPNWQLRFIHNQLFKHFYNPSRFCPGAFHSTIARKVEFRSRQHKDAYFAMCKAVLEKWKLAGPRPLNANPVDNKSGIWLFQDRTKPTHFFPPNFLPPYDTEEKRQIILSYLTEEWDEETLS